MNSISTKDNFSITVTEKKDLVTISIIDNKPSIQIDISEMGSPGKTGAKGLKGERGERGERGQKGNKGDNAENPNFTIITGSPGSEAVIEGDYPNLQITIPRGDVGLGFPSGGVEKSVLIKKTNTDYDTEWKILSLDDLSNGSSFETITNNLRSYPVIDTTFEAGVSLSKTFQTPNGNIVVTTNFTDGKPSTKVLSGSGVPGGIPLTKTYDFTGRTIPLVTYS